jgi:hypothetical protein
MPAEQHHVSQAPGSCVSWAGGMTVMVLLAVSLVSAEVASPSVGACHLIYWRAHAAVVLLSACRPDSAHRMQPKTV